jgi:hypothetical protein
MVVLLAGIEPSIGAAFTTIGNIAAKAAAITRLRI